jgi:hypothetical protein
MYVAVREALELKNNSYICIDMYFWWNIEGKTRCEGKKKKKLRSEPNASHSHLHPEPHASLALQIIFHYEAPIWSMPKWHDMVWQGN